MDNSLVVSSLLFTDIPKDVLTMIGDLVNSQDWNPPKIIWALAKKNKSLYNAFAPILRKYETRILPFQNILRGDAQCKLLLQTVHHQYSVIRLFKQMPLFLLLQFLRVDKKNFLVEETPNFARSIIHALNVRPFTREENNALVVAYNQDLKQRKKGRKEDQKRALKRKAEADAKANTIYVASSDTEEEEDEYKLPHNLVPPLEDKQSEAKFSLLPFDH